MNLSSTSGIATSAYVAQLLAKAQSASTTSAAASATNTGTVKTKAEEATQTVSSRLLASISTNRSFAASQQAVDKQSTALITDLKNAMAQVGVKLGGTIELSINSASRLQVKGSDEDKTAIGAFLAADKSSPSLSSRLASLASDANALSSGIQKTAAISQAARYSSTSNFLSAYGTLVQGQSATASVLSLSTSSASFSYPGMLASRA
jgi:hypothetical protein